MFMQLLFKCEWLLKQRPDFEFFNSLPLNLRSKVLEKNCHLQWSCVIYINLQGLLVLFHVAWLCLGCCVVSGTLSGSHL
jgi:hypothetical protein